MKQKHNEFKEHILITTSTSHQYIAKNVFDLK